MKKINLRNAAMICLASVTFFCGCEKEDTPIDTTATGEVKEVTLSEANLSNRFELGNYDGTINIYETFDRLYSIGYSQGNLYCIVRRRINGSWAEAVSYVWGRVTMYDYDRNIRWLGTSDSSLADILSEFLSMSAHDFISVGAVNSLSDISDRDNYLSPIFDGWEWYLNAPRNLPISPSEGYVIIYPSDGNTGWQYVRLKIKSYTTDNSGTINSVTVQYQTF